MLRVVLDTNVLVSALLKPDSTPELVISLILEKQALLCLSDAIAVEYDEVLRRPKFKSLDPNKVESFLYQLKAKARLVSPKIYLDIVETDPGDNKFLECAQEAKADFLITGNTKHFPFKKFKKTRIVSPAEFLTVIAKKLPM
jgi:uncharacterized protein